MKRILEVAFLTAVLVALCGAMSSIAKAEEVFVPNSYTESAITCVLLALEVIEANNLDARISSVLPAPFGLVEVEIRQANTNSYTVVYCGSNKTTGTSYIDTSIVDVMRHFSINNPI